VVAGGNLAVRVDRVLDALETLPVYIALMGVGDQRKPLITRHPAINVTRFTSHIAGASFGLTVGIGTAVDRVGENLIQRAVGGALPTNLPT
jgi:hypothetical protein